MFILSDINQTAKDSHMVTETESLHFILTALLCLYGLVMLISLLSLFLYHLNLIAINQTTNEVLSHPIVKPYEIVRLPPNNLPFGLFLYIQNMKGVYASSKNTFDEGCCLNYYNL